MATTGNPQGDQPPLRFEANLGPLSRRKAVAAAAELDLDRLPDVGGKVRLLITAADAQRLLERGHEVRLVAALPARPMDPKLVMSDAQARRWLETQLKDLPRKGGR